MLKRVYFSMRPETRIIIQASATKNLLLPLPLQDFLMAIKEDRIFQFHMKLGRFLKVKDKEKSKLIF